MLSSFVTNMSTCIADLKGQVVIVNISGVPDCKLGPGSGVDVSRLTDLWKYLGFRVELVENLTEIVSLVTLTILIYC